MDSETGKSLTFITNHFELPALTVAAIYKKGMGWPTIMAKRKTASGRGQTRCDLTTSGLIVRTPCALPEPCDFYPASFNRLFFIFAVR